MLELASIDLKNINYYGLTRLKKRIETTTAFAMGDIPAMFAYMPKNAAEDYSAIAHKPRNLRLIVKRILQEYLNGVTGLPIYRTVPNYPDFDFDFATKFYDAQTIQTRSEIEGMVAVRPLYQDGFVYPQIFSASEVVPITQPKTGKLEGLILCYESGKEKITEIWTEQDYSYYVNGTLTMYDINPYSTIPFAIYRARKHPTSFYGVSDLESIVEQNNAINKMLWDLNQLATEQAFSIYVYTGPKPDTEETQPEALKIGVGRMLEMPEGGDLKTVAPEAAIDAVNNVIESQMKDIFEDASVFVLEKNSEYSSGFSILVKKGPYLRTTQYKRNLFIEADERYFELAQLARVVAQFGPSTLDDSFQVKTEIDATSLTPETAQEELLRDKFELEQGIVTPVDLIEKDRQVSKEVAEKIYVANQATKSVPSGTSKAPDGASMMQTNTDMNKPSMG